MKVYLFLQSMEGGEALAFLDTFLPTQLISRWASHRACRLASRLLTIGAAMMLSLLAGGCSRVQTSIEDLMSPPVLTEEQAQIRDALARVSGDGEIKYRYPQNGEYRSSYIFYDIDADGVEEAMVFYQSASKGEATWINILDQQNGEWVSVCETPAPDSTANIDFVSFEQLTGDGEISIVIGWEDLRSSKTAIAYHYQSGRLLPIFEREYTEIAIADLDGSGTTDLVLFTPQAQSTLVFLACETENGFETVDSLTLPRSILSFDSVLTGATSTGSSALFLDSTVEVYVTAFQVTDVISAQAEEDGTPKLVNLLDNELLSLSESTLRPAQNIYCRDIDGDGLIEIPTVSTLPGYEDLLSEEIPFLTTYNQLLPNEQLSPKQSGVINTQHRYMLRFPQRWIGQVSAVVQPENGEWTFFVYNGDLQDTSQTLLRIRVYSAKDYHDKFDGDYFQLIGQKGLFEYYAYVLPSQSELAITQQELTGEMFFFLD